MPNTTCYILNDDELPVRVGEKGTMWVGGSGVSGGYINLPELTSQRYKLDKFLQDGSVLCIITITDVLIPNQIHDVQHR